MSYRSFKRVLGETRLELKCLLLFAICLLLADRQQLLVVRQQDRTHRGRTEFARHLPELDRRGHAGAALEDGSTREDLDRLIEDVDGKACSIANIKYNFIVPDRIAPNQSSQTLLQMTFRRYSGIVSRDSAARVVGPGQWRESSHVLTKIRVPGERRIQVLSTNLCGAVRRLRSMSHRLWSSAISSAGAGSSSDRGGRPDGGRQD